MQIHIHIPSPLCACRLSLDKEDILNWGDYTKDDVLLYSCLSAKWENNDAIDKAVTSSLGDKKVCFYSAYLIDGAGFFMHPPAAPAPAQFN